MSEFFTIRDLAERWQLSTQTVRRKISSGEVTALHVGRAVRIERAEVERLESDLRQRAKQNMPD